MIRLTIEGLETLDAIARHGTFSGAAKELHKVPSAISYTVARLEESLGVKLFDRTGPKAFLTPAANELLEDGRELLRVAKSLEQKAALIGGKSEPELRFALDPSLSAAFFEAELRKFSKDTRGRGVRIHFESLRGGWDALAANRIDLVIAVGRGPVADNMICQELVKLEFKFCVAPGHPLASANEPITSETRSKFTAIAVADSSQSSRRISVGVVPGQKIISVPDLTSKVQLISTGMGVGHLADPIASRLAQKGAVVVKRVADPRPDDALCVGWRVPVSDAGLQWWCETLTSPEMVKRIHDAARSFSDDVSLKREGPAG